MSDIPKARRLLYAARQNLTLAERELAHVGSLLLQASALLDREPQIRRAPAKHVPITRKLRQQVLSLAATTQLTQEEIAHVTGLRSPGRVSEILNGKR